MRVFLKILLPVALFTVSLSVCASDGIKPICQTTLHKDLMTLNSFVQEDVLKSTQLSVEELDRKLQQLNAAFSDYSVLNLMTQPELVFERRVQNGHESMQGWYGRLMFTKGQLLKIFLNSETGEIRYFIGQVELINESSFKVTFSSSYVKKLEGKTHTNEFKINGQKLEISNPKNGFTEIWHIYDNWN